MRDLCANHLTTHRTAATALRAALAMSVLGVALPASAFDIKYAHSLATTTGVIRMTDTALSFDPFANEVFATSGGTVRIFNESGMETYTFGADLVQAHPQAVVALEDGDLLALVSAESGFALVRCTYRGELLGPVELRNVPERLLREFNPRTLRALGENLYIADLAAKRVIVVRTTGEFVKDHDLGALAGMSDADRESNDVGGFNVDANGNLLFTVPTLFLAYVASPDGEVRAFGQKGSAPGKFNVIKAIAADEAGNFYVSDVLKSAVIVFDKEFRYLREFGYRGRKAGSLVGPIEVVYGGGKLYVSQRARRGVNVYEVTQDG